jgi:predicted MFS family arabinose efflux permease
MVHFGWRGGYVGVGAVIIILAFPLVALFLREPPGHQPVRGATAAALPGMSGGEALKSWRFWALLVALFLTVAAVNGVITQAVPLLTDRATPVQVAVGVLSITGLVTVIARILAGWSLDRFNGPLVGAVCFGLSMIGMILLAAGVRGHLALLGVVLCGIAVGAEVDLIAFYVSRYFGLRAFGTIYGYMFPAIPIGVGAGAAFMGGVHDHAHSYVPALIGNAAMIFVSIVLILSLGAYRYPKAETAELAATAVPTPTGG